MQTYPLGLVAGGAATTIQVQADLFVYESGAATPTTGDTRIAIKSDNGAEIVLRPGQRFRVPEEATRWTIQAYDKVTAIAGFIIIGSGEFDDANTKNTFTLDATFANKVEVTNDTTKRIPVTLDSSQVLNVAGNTVQYTNSYATVATADTIGTQIFSAAQNPNGAYVELVEVSICNNSNAGTAGAHTVVTLLAKATAPANDADGDVVFVAASGVGMTNTLQPVVNVTQTVRIKIPAGKGLFLNRASPISVPTQCRQTILYTLL